MHTQIIRYFQCKKMDRNHNPFLTSFEEFKFLDLKERRYVLYSMLSELVSTEKKVEMLQNQINDLDRKITQIEDEQIFSAYNYKVPQSPDESNDIFLKPSPTWIANKRQVK